MKPGLPQHPAPPGRQPRRDRLPGDAQRARPRHRQRRRAQRHRPPRPPRRRSRHRRRPGRRQAPPTATCAATGSSPPPSPAAPGRSTPATASSRRTPTSPAPARSRPALPRTAGGGHRRHGQQVGRQGADGRSRRAAGARLSRRSQDLETFRREARAHRLPGAAQGRRWRRRQEHEGGGARGRAGRGPSSAQREAKAAFGDARMLVEKYLLKPRHVEIRVFADRHGHCLYLNERDCSIQRRHQGSSRKPPAPGLGAELRRAMGEAAARAAQAIGSVGAGTVEFLLDERGQFFFLGSRTPAWRWNTRSPKPSPASAWSAWQIPRRSRRGATADTGTGAAERPRHRSAALRGRPRGRLPPRQRPPWRCTAEAPTGPAGGSATEVREGDEVSPFYDPMLLTLIAWGETREEARQRLLAMLAEASVVTAVQPAQISSAASSGHPAFAAAELDTGFHRAPPRRPAAGAAKRCGHFWLEAAAEAWLQSEPGRRRDDDPAFAVEHATTGWRSAGAGGRPDAGCRGEDAAASRRHASPSQYRLDAATTGQPGGRCHPSLGGVAPADAGCSSNGRANCWPSKPVVPDRRGRGRHMPTGVV